MSEALFDDPEPWGDIESQSDADVVCPYCGETVTLLLDTGGGARQEYVEDCEVCCRPWNVKLLYDGSGRATVRLEPA